MSRRARRRNQDGDLERRTERAHRLVQLGELSSARQALEGSDLAPGNRNTLEALQARPGLPRDPLPDDIVGHMPARAFELNEARFGQNLRSSRRGAASGPSGLIAETQRWHSRNCRRRQHPPIGLTYNGPTNGSCSGEGNRSPPVRTTDPCRMRVRFSRTPDAV